MDIWGIIIGILTLVVLIFQAYVYHRQANIMKEQASISKEQLELSKILERDRHPTIALRFLENKHESIIVELRVFNNSPASITFYNIEASKLTLREGTIHPIIIQPQSHLYFPCIKNQNDKQKLAAKMRRAEGNELERYFYDDLDHINFKDYVFQYEGQKPKSVEFTIWIQPSGSQEPIPYHRTIEIPSEASSQA